MKKIIAAILSLSLALGVFAGCGDTDKDSSTAGESSTKSAAAKNDDGGDAEQRDEDGGNYGGDTGESEETAAKIAEPDLMGFLVGAGTPEFYGMTLEEFSEAAGGGFTKDTASDYDEYDEKTYMHFSLGKMSSILGGRVALPKEEKVMLYLEFWDGKLKVMGLKIEGLEKDEARAIGDGFIEAFDGKLPEGYEQFKPLDHGKSMEVGFSKTINDYVMSVKSDEDMDGDYYAYFALQNYAERYGMV